MTNLKGTGGAGSREPAPRGDVLLQRPRNMQEQGGGRKREKAILSARQTWRIRAPGRGSTVSGIGH